MKRKEQVRYAIGDDVLVKNEDLKAFGQGILTVVEIVFLKSGEVRYVVARKHEAKLWRKNMWRVGFNDIERDGT